jgi:DivIVA domain-containing protein
MGGVNIVFLIAAVGVVIAIALLAVGRLGELPAASHDRAPLDLPDGELDAADVDGVKFALGLRGYRMDEVDVVLDRVADDLAERDVRIAQLEATLQTAGVVVPAPRAQLLPAAERPEVFDFEVEDDA